MDYANFAEFFSSVREVAGEYLPHFVTAIIVGAVMSFAIFFRDRRDWKRSRFESRINLSINIIGEQSLHIRTLLEANVEDVVLSSYARKLLKKAARQTTNEDPFVHFPTANDEWMVYNEILNTISGLYGKHFLSAAIHGTIDNEEKFLMAITWERDADIRIQKLRVLLVHEDMLRKMHDHRKAGREIHLERPNHKERVETLLKLYELVNAGKWSENKKVSLPRM